MCKKTAEFCGSIFLFGFIILFPAFAQESAKEPAAASDTAVTPQPLAKEPEMQWVWAEVVSVSLEKKEIVVKYLDYETEEEKEMTITVDDKSIYENVKVVEEIRPQDTLSIDYIITPEGKNLAKNISVEKFEEIEPQPQPEEKSTAPQESESGQAREAAGEVAE